MNQQGKKWQNGWWQAAEHQTSPNYSAREVGQRVSLVVLHNISLPPFEYGNGAVEQLFTNNIDASKHPFFSILVDLRVSSHFFITRLGQTIQFVSCDDIAYHAGASSFLGREQCNAFSIGVELEGCDFEAFTNEQYKALCDLLAALQLNYPIEAITGHQDIAPGRKSDPGHFFDWAKLQQAGLLVIR